VQDKIIVNEQRTNPVFSLNSYMLCLNKFEIIKGTTDRVTL